MKSNFKIKALFLALMFMSIGLNAVENKLSVGLIENFLVYERYENGNLREIKSSPNSFILINEKPVNIKGYTSFYPEGEIKSVFIESKTELYAGDKTILAKGRVNFYKNGAVSFAEVEDSSATLKPNEQQTVKVGGDVFFDIKGRVIQGDSLDGACLNFKNLIAPACNIKTIALHPETFGVKFISGFAYDDRQITLHFPEQTVNLRSKDNPFYYDKAATVNKNGEIVKARLAFYQKLKYRPGKSAFFGSSPQSTFTSEGFVTRGELLLNASFKRVDGRNVRMGGGDASNTSNFVEFNQGGLLIGHTVQRRNYFMFNNRKVFPSEGSLLSYYPSGELHRFYLEKKQALDFEIVGDPQRRKLKLYGSITLDRNGRALKGYFLNPTKIYFNKLNPELLVKFFDFTEQDQLSEIRNFKNLKLSKRVFVHHTEKFNFGKSTVTPTSLSSHRDFYKVDEYVNAESKKTALFTLWAYSMSGFNLEFDTTSLNILACYRNCKNHILPDGTPSYLLLSEKGNMTSYREQNVGIFGRTEFDKSGKLTMTNINENLSYHEDGDLKLIQKGTVIFPMTNKHYWRNCPRRDSCFIDKGFNSVD
ncbi:MAG: hypothetical protein AB8E15_09530 [Bdellovibrionales bacterium]